MCLQADPEVSTVLVPLAKSFLDLCIIAKTELVYEIYTFSLAG